MSDDEQPTVEQLAAENARLKEQNQSVALRAAWDSQDDYRWHSAGDALAAAQHKGYLQDVQTRDDGTVDEVALRKAIRAFARENEYMVNAGEQKPKRPVPPFPSGGNVGSGRRRYDAPAASEEYLRRKYRGL
jgi:hypothetical protein